METLKVKTLTEGGGLWTPQRDGDVGFDLVVSKDTIVLPNPQPTATLIPSGVAIKCPEGYACTIIGRSSAANKRGLMVVTAQIDNGYLGELKACVFNMTDDVIIVSKGDRICQAVFHPICVPEIELVRLLEETERGTDGFGSTGV